MQIYVKNVKIAKFQMCFSQNFAIFFIEISLLEIKELVQCLDIIIINLEERVRNIR